MHAFKFNEENASSDSVLSSYLAVWTNNLSEKTGRVERLNWQVPTYNL